MIVINSTIPPANEQNSKHRWLHITDQVAMRNELLVLLPLNVGDSTLVERFLKGH